MKRLNLFSFLRRSLNQQDGFSLAEVMVAAGMLGVLSLGVTQLMQNSSKTEKRLGQQVNMVQLEASVQDALRNQVACNRTFYAADAGCPGCGGTPGVSTASGGVVPADSPNWHALPHQNIGGNVSRIFGGNRDTVTNPNVWQTVLAEYNAAQGTGVYGNGGNTISIRDITYQGFFDPALTGDPRIDNAANYNATGNGDLTPIAGSNPAHSIGHVVVRVRYVRGRWEQLRTLADDNARQAQSAKITTGPWQLTKYYPVKVRVNAAAPNSIIRCLGSEEDYLSMICESMFGGYLDEADGRCKSTMMLRDFNSTSAGHPDEWTMVAQNDVAGVYPAGSGGNVLVEDRLLVGGDWGGAAVDDAIPASRGDIIARNDIQALRSLNVGKPLVPASTTGDAAFQRDIQVDRDANVTRDANVLRDGNIRRGLNVGNPTTIANATGNASIDNHLLVEGHIRTNLAAAPGGAANGDVYFNGKGKVYNSFAIGAAANPSGNNGESVIQVRETIGLNATDANSALRVHNGRGHFSNGTRNVYINNGTTNQALAVYQGGTIGMQMLQDGGYSIYYHAGVRSIRINQLISGNYRAIKIYNQPINTANFAFGMNSEEANEVTTKKWVKRFVYGKYYENNGAQIQDMIDNMQNYVNHRPWETVRATMCNQTVLRVGGFTSSCSYSGGVCTCQQSNCSSREGSMNGAGAHCANMRISGFIRAQGTGAYIYSNGYIQALNNIVAGSYVQAGSYMTAGTTISAGAWIRGREIYTNAVANPGSGNMRAVNLYATASIYAGADAIITNRVRAAKVSGTRVCEFGGHTNNALCYTRFGRFRCGGNRVMVGIAYGVPVCAVVGDTTVQPAGGRF